MYQGRREEGVPRAGAVYDLDLEGRDAAAELPGGVESPFRTQAHEYQGCSARDQAFSGFSGVLNPKQRRELVVAQLDDGGEIEQRVHDLAGSLDARPEVFAEVDVEGRRNVQLARKLRGLVDRRTARFFYQEYAPEVHERGPGQEFPGDVLLTEELVGGRVGAVEGEEPVALIPDLHEGQRGARGRLAAPDPRGVHALGLQRPQDEVPEEILPHAPGKRRPFSETGSGDGDVRRRPARPRGEGQLFLRRALVPIDVRDDLAQSYYLSQVLLLSLLERG